MVLLVVAFKSCVSSRWGESYSTALIDATGSSDRSLEHIRSLLEGGVDPNGRDSLGGTALSAAIAIGSAEKVRLLVEFGADPNLKVFEFSPLVFAGKPKVHTSEADDLWVIDVLLSAGADPCVTVSGGEWDRLRASEIARRSGRSAAAAALAKAEERCD